MRPAIIGCLAVLAGAMPLACGESGVPPAQGRAAAAAEVVEQLEIAVREGDWRFICDRLYSSGVRAQAGGEECPKLLARVTEGLAEPTIEIDSITLGGRRAEVEVITRARGQAPVRETIRLAAGEQGRLQIAGLGG